MKTFKSFIVEEKKATITKKESYRGRTTADVEYNVHDENGRLIRTTKTKREAKCGKICMNCRKRKCIKNIPS